MRTPTLQYLYLQKPVTMVVIICMISVLPWMATGDFSTTGEPREAAIAISMLESGNWILPQVYADELSNQPPLAHWLMAVFSYPQGYVSGFTARLPSALAFITLMGFSLFFFGERVKFQEAFIAILLLLTCLGIHRAGMTIQVDMLFTTFMVIALYQMYRWENKLELKGLPVAIPILLGCAILTKGLVGIILPLFIFGIYLFILKTHRLLTVFKTLLYIGISSLFIPILWYVAAWKQGGEEFINIFLKHTFSYENGIWVNFVSLAIGFIPWTIFFLFSIFGLPWKNLFHFKQLAETIKNRIRTIEKIKLFSLVAFICIFIFYCFPSVKRSAFLLPAYPFIALFLAQYAIYLTEYRNWVTRIYAGFLVFLTISVLTIIALIRTGFIDLLSLSSSYTENGFILEILESINNSFISNSWVTFLIIFVSIIALGMVIYQMSKKINIKILYSTIFLVLTFNLFVDGIIMRNIREDGSARFFAEQIQKQYPLNENNMFVMNNPNKYGNLYGLNFYLDNHLHNFEKVNPNEGYFLSREQDLSNVLDNYGNIYSFEVLETSHHYLLDIQDKAVLARFVRK